MLPLDTYKKNRRNYAFLRQGDDKVFAYPCTCVGQSPRPPYYQKWWNVQMFHRRIYRELSYDFKHNEMNHVR